MSGTEVVVQADPARYHSADDWERGLTRPFVGGGVLFGALIAASSLQCLSASAQQIAAAPSSRGSMELKVRRLPDSVELIIVNAGTAPQLQQNTQGSSWQGILITESSNGLRRGSQRVALPEAGLQSITLEGSGTQYRLKVTPAPGYPVGRPLVSSDGRDLILSFSAPAQPTLKTFSPDATLPGRVPDPTYVPPLQARAVAPPVGDMAVGTMMLSNPSYLNVSGPPVTMTLKNAPAKDVLMAISRFGGYGFVYVDDEGGGGDDQAGQRPISIAFRGETFSRAVNSALLAAGLQGKVEGNMILAGPSVLGKSFGAQMSKVYRLNQVSALSAADYLSNLGARITRTFLSTSTNRVSETSGTPGNASAATTTEQSSTLETQAYGASQGPLLGLIGTTDSRLGTITLVGDPRVVAIAESYLKQLDLRQRQVALAVKILDVNLENAQEIANSFAYRWGNNFIVNDQGRLLGAFGKDLPPSQDLGEFEFNNLDVVADSSSSARARSGDVTLSDVNGVRNLATGLAGQGQDTNVRTSESVGIKRRNPGRIYQDNSFFDFVQATIESRSTKLLASPTLILQENADELRDDGGGGGGDADGGLDAYTINSPIGRQQANEGVVRVGTNVITNVNISGGSGDNSFQTCELELSTAGLVLGARVQKIDDNGFVTFSLSPSISAVTDSVDGPPQCTSEIAILSVRRLDTGAVRVRDGQTLILTGVISDVDLAEVRKWPILGDLPLVGQFFRASNNSREKRELVIMVTPRIIDDSQGGAYGYGYQPGTRQSRDFLRTGS